VQSIELAVAAEERGVAGAYVRVHHVARQLASPFPLLSAMAATPVLITVPTMLGAGYDARLPGDITRCVARSAGCTESSAVTLTPRGGQRRSKPRSSTGALWVSAPTAR
jgi:hypothetical protein